MQINYVTVAPPLVLLKFIFIGTQRGTRNSGYN